MSSARIYQGKNIKQWAAHLGITGPSFSNRLSKHDGNFAAAIAMGDKQQKGATGKLYTYNGKSQGLREWALEIGVAFGFLYYRTNKHGFAAAIKMRPNEPGKNDTPAQTYTFNNEARTIRQWAAHFEVPYQLMYSRITQSGIKRAIELTSMRIEPRVKVKRREQLLILRVGVQRQQIVCVGSGQALTDLVDCFVCEVECGLRGLLV